MTNELKLGLTIIKHHVLNNALLYSSGICQNTWDKSLMTKKTNSHVLPQMNKKAKKLDEFYIASFCLKSNLYRKSSKQLLIRMGMGRPFWFQTFGKQSHCNWTFWLDYMTFMTHSLNTSCRNWAIHCDYHVRDVTHWNEQEQYGEPTKI